jgi:hypothetical protein
MVIVQVLKKKIVSERVLYSGANLGSHKKRAK